MADQLAAVTLAAKDEAGLGSTSETQQHGAVERYDPLSDPDLWKPHPPTEDCPVCLVPLPLEINKYTCFLVCCGKLICKACNAENERALRIINEKRSKKELPPLDQSCAFCRETTIHDSDSELLERLKKRIDKGDVEAIHIMGVWRLNGVYGQKDEAKGIELLEKAAIMGSAKAMHHLGYACSGGAYGVRRDEKKGFEYFKDAVKKGDVPSRCMLAAGYSRGSNLANKHYRLAAEAGHPIAVEQIWKQFHEKKLNKADLEEILRVHQSACDEMDSVDRQRYAARDAAKAGNDGTLKGLYESYYMGHLNAKQLEEGLKMHRNKGGIAEIQEFVRKCGNF